MAKPKSKPFRKPIAYKKTLDEYTGPVTNNGGLGKRTVNNGIRGRGAYDKRSGQFRGVKWSSTPLAGSQTVQIGSGTASKPAVKKTVAKKTAAKKTVAKPVAKPAVKKTAAKLSPAARELSKVTGKGTIRPPSRAPAKRVTALGKYIDQICLGVTPTIPTTMETILPNYTIREWYVHNWPDDELGRQIRPGLTFKTFREYDKKGYDLYKLLDVGDSIVRERIQVGIEEAYRDGVPQNVVAPSVQKKIAKTPAKPTVKKTAVPYAIGPTTNIRAWYMKTYPTDELGAEIEPTLTFASVWAGMRAGKDFYNMVSEADSIVRERIFEGISNVYKIPYDAVYEVWINKGEKKPVRQSTKKSPFNDPHISIVRPAINLQSGKDGGARNLGPMESYLMDLLKTTERYVMDLDDGPTQTFQAAKAGQMMINAGRAYASKRSPTNKAAFAKALREFLIEIQKSDAFYEVPPTSDIKLAINGLRQEAGL